MASDAPLAHWIRLGILSQRKPSHRSLETLHLNALVLQRQPRCPSRIKSRRPKPSSQLSKRVVSADVSRDGQWHGLPALLPALGSCAVQSRRAHGACGARQRVGFIGKDSPNLYGKE